MTLESPVLTGRYIRFEPLSHVPCRRARRRVCRRSRTLSSGVPFPVGRDAVSRYIETATCLARSRHGACPSPLSASRTARFSVRRVSSTSNAGRGPPATHATVAAIPMFAKSATPGYAQRHPHRRKYRSQAADAHARFRGMAGAPRLPAHRRAQPALAGRH